MYTNFCINARLNHVDIYYNYILKHSYRNIIEWADPILVPRVVVVDIAVRVDIVHIVRVVGTRRLQPTVINPT